VDADDARRELGDAGLTFSRIEPVADQGWASWTFELDGRFIVRFPRDAEIVDAMHREMRLLPALAAHVSFRVPEPVHVSDDWYVYEKIPGRAFRRGDDLHAALAMIDELHTFPVDEARRLLRRPSRIESFAATRAMFEAEVFPLLDDVLLERVQPLCEPPPLDHEVFVHDDLGAEHVLVDEHGRAVGIIDFEDATVGDPEVDRMPVHVVSGRPLTERMWFYRCRSVLHHLVHDVREGDLDEIPGAIAELRRRLDSRPGQ
jgi:aminoglycoside 2''-phosphotransferase